MTSAMADGGRRRRRAAACAAAAALASAVAVRCGGGAGDPCAGVECSSRGFCIVDQAAASCACIRGFHPVGLAWEANDPDDPCAGIACGGHGTCRATDDGPACDCDPGYHHPGAGDPRCNGLECDLVCAPDARIDADGPVDEVAAPDADGDGGPDRDADGPVDEVAAPDADADAPCIAPGVPAPLSPANGAATGSVHAPGSRLTLRPPFRWRAPEPDACGPPAYEIQVDDSCATPGFASCAFPSPEASADGLGDLSWRPPGDLAVSTSPPMGRRYYWRVRACRGTDCSAWSPVRYVDVGRAPGDVNGDGYSDVLAGAIFADAPGPGGLNAGRAYLYLGGAAPDCIADATLDGEAIDDRFGAAAAAAGDVNADGFADLLVGAPGHTGPAGADCGRAYLYLGGATPDSVADVVFDGDGPGDQLGAAVAGGGDVNADGYADVVVGAPYHDAPPGSGDDAGEVHVYFGGAAPDSTADVSFFGSAARAGLGAAVAIAGDANGDGYADVAAGAPALWATEAGRAYLYFGGASPDSAADVALMGDTMGDFFGSVVAAGGDVAGDGYADLLVGAYHGDDDGRANDAGRGYLLLGGPAPHSAADATFRGDAANDHLGRAAAIAGDLDGDGFADLLLGAPENDAGGLFAGRAYVFLGAASPDTVADAVFTGAREDSLAYSLSGGGDVNGDGHADVVAGAPVNGTGAARPGQVLVFFGGAALDPVADVSCAGESLTDQMGTSVAGGGLGVP